MKFKIFTILTITLSAINATAQNVEDLLKYNFTQQGGTARNLATGGAMASLGGEFSSLFVNPAGLSFYRTKEFVLTPKINLNKNTSTYRNGVKNINTLESFNIGASGVVLGSPSFKNNNNEKVNFACGFGINQTANFNNAFSYSGNNNFSSYAEKFTEELINNNITDPNKAVYLFPNSSSLALNTYLVDPIFSGGRVIGYGSVANNALGNGLVQTNTVNTYGGMYDISFGAAVNINNKVHVGGSASLVVTNFERNQTYTEKEALPVLNNSFNSFTLQDNLTTKGAGLNIKAGIIYRPTQKVRLGFAVHTPTMSTLTDVQNTTLTTDTENYKGIQKQSTSDVLNYQRNILGQVVTQNLKYDFNTPWRLMLSGSYVFREIENTKKQRAFITADIEYLNYKNLRLRATDREDTNYDSYLKAQKQEVKKMYAGAFNARIGGELKLNIFMVRAGLAYYGNPLKDKANYHVNRLNASAGLGYRNKGFFIDATYVHSMGKDVDRPYILSNRENTFANLKTRVGAAVLTFGLKF